MPGKTGDFRRASGLSDAKIETVISWVDNDTPFGDEADLP